MKRIYRLTQSSEIQRVRRSGSSFAHPLLVLIVEKSLEEIPFKVTFLASKSLGCAVSRNRAKRVLRAGFEEFVNQVIPGCNLLIIARAGLLSSTFKDVKSALYQVLRKAYVLNEND